MAFLKRLRRSKTRPRELRPKLEPVKTPSRMRVGWATDVGRVRTHNEDAVLIVQTSQEGGETMPPFGLFILADGMGGHQSGEVASAMAARRAARHILHEVYGRLLLGQDRSADQPSVSEVLVQAVTLANTAVAVGAPGGGTTLTCALVVDRQAHIAHVGDSRAYLVSPDGLKQLTRDHSLVDRLVEMGQLTAAEAANHPQKNVLYRAVGQGGMLEVDTYLHSIPLHSHLLLCSDGLWGALGDARMAEIIAASPNPQVACQSLVRAANQAGGRDNITAILVTPPAE